MTIKSVRRAALGFLACSVALGVWSSIARAITEDHAALLTRRYAYERAACHSAYWKCTNFFGPNCSSTHHDKRGVAQWACTVFVFRQKRHVTLLGNAHSQACGVSASWDPYGHQLHGLIRCRYSLEN